MPLPEEEECNTWEMPPKDSTELLYAEEKGEPGTVSNALAPNEKSGLLVAIFSILISIPALVGSWCWPLLVASILGIASSATARAFSHALTWGVTLALLSNIAQFIFHKCGKRNGRHFHKWGPFYLALLAIPLVLIDLSRHVLVDYGYLTGAGMYRNNCNSANISCLSPLGWFTTIFCTYSGYVLLVIANIWVSNLHMKIRDSWRKLRGSHSK